MFDLEDMDGLVRTICWPEDYARCGEILQPDAVVLVAGSIDRRAGSEETNLVVNHAVPLADVGRVPVKAVTIKVDEKRHDATTLDRLAELLRRHPGPVPVRLFLDLVDGTRVLLEVDRDRVAWSPALLGELCGLLGPGSVRAAVALGGGSGQDAPRRSQPGDRAGRVPLHAR
jgi:DNA polymerase-3 subunit alpha